MSILSRLRNSPTNKNQSQEDCRLKHKRILKCLEGNKKEDIHDLRVGKDFLNIIQKKQ